MNTITSKYPTGSRCVNAIYTPSDQALHAGNPLIEALPPIIDPKDQFVQMIHAIPYNQAELALPYYQRSECVNGVYKVFQPYGIHIDLAQRLSRAIRGGYVDRNPFSVENTIILNALTDSVENRDSQFRNLNISNGAPGFSILGMSGTGKTYSLNTVLSLYPQMIAHSQYHGKTFPALQIVWIKIDCPFDGTIKGLCRSFFEEFDRCTGDRTTEKYASGSRTTVDSMITQMALIARRHFLGALIIDEVQFISAAKSGGAEKMMNFIINMVNKIGVPVILVGIPEAIEILSRNFMNARRNTGEQGSLIIKPIKEGSKDWNSFLTGIWKYQWTNVNTPLDKKLMHAIYYYSYGIADVAVKLFVRSQQYVIERGQDIGQEIITPEIICKVADSDDFKLYRKKIYDLLNRKDPIDDYDREFLDARWGRLKDFDIKNALPSTKQPKPAATERNNKLQDSISIPKVNTATDLLKPEDLLKNGHIIQSGP